MKMQPQKLHNCNVINKTAIGNSSLRADLKLNKNCPYMQVCHFKRDVPYVLFYDLHSLSVTSSSPLPTFLCSIQEHPHHTPTIQEYLITLADISLCKSRHLNACHHFSSCFFFLIFSLPFQKSLPFSKMRMKEIVSRQTKQNFSLPLCIYLTQRKINYNSNPKCVQMI